MYPTQEIQQISSHVKYQSCLPNAWPPACSKSQHKQSSAYMHLSSLQEKKWQMAVIGEQCCPSSWKASLFRLLRLPKTTNASIYMHKFSVWDFFSERIWALLKNSEAPEAKLWVYEPQPKLLTRQNLAGTFVWYLGLCPSLQFKVSSWTYWSLHVTKEPSRKCEKVCLLDIILEMLFYQVLEAYEKFDVYNDEFGSWNGMTYCAVRG